MPPAKQPHPLLDLLLTVVLPSGVLEYLSEPARLGPFWALVVSALLPLGYGIYCLLIKAGLNFFSLLGLAAVIITGGLGLLQLSAFWIGIKELSVPLIIGIAFPLSHRWGKPVIASMLFAPHLINERVLQASLDTSDKKLGFQRLLFRASAGLGFSMLMSGVVNFFLALYLIGDKAPGSEAYVKALGTLNWAGTLLIGIPLMIAMMVVLLRFMRGVFAITGLEKDDLMGPGRTVRRQV